MITDLTSFAVTSDQTLLDAMRCIDRNMKGIALVVADGRLLYTVTDGDLRRAVMHGIRLETTIGAWALGRREIGNVHPMTALLGTPLAAIRQMMKTEGLRHMPIVDDRGALVGLVLADELLDPIPLDVRAVVMAGGRGHRLLPLTADVPKPLLPIGDRPLIEHIVDRLRRAGIQEVSITTHYHGDQIVNHFGDGRRFGLDIRYVNEDEPLGTAGALALLPSWQSTLLVLNGDVLTRVNYHSMLSFHREHQAVMTVGVRHYEVPMPYGIVETDGVKIRGIEEKPTLRFFANAGVYLLEPTARDYLTAGGPLDMPDVITALVNGGQPVVSFPISEYWVDIGRHDDYRRAQVDAQHGID